MYQSLCNI